MARQGGGEDCCAVLAPATFYTPARKYRTSGHCMNSIPQVPCRLNHDGHRTLEPAAGRAREVALYLSHTPTLVICTPTHNGWCGVRNDGSFLAYGSCCTSAPPGWSLVFFGPVTSHTCDEKQQEGRSSFGCSLNPHSRPSRQKHNRRGKTSPGREFFQIHNGITE